MSDAAIVTRDLFFILRRFYVAPRLRALLATIEERPYAFIALWSTLLAFYALFFDFSLSSTTLAARSLNAVTLYGFFTLAVAALTYGALPPPERELRFFAALPIEPERVLSLGAAWLLARKSWLPALFAALSTPFVLRHHALNPGVVPLHLLVCALAYVRVTLLAQAAPHSRRARRLLAPFAAASLGSYLIDALYSTVWSAAVVAAVELLECALGAALLGSLAVRAVGARHPALERLLESPAPRLPRFGRWSDRLLERIGSPVLAEFTRVHLGRAVSLPALLLAGAAFVALPYAAFALPGDAFRAAAARPRVLATLFGLFVLGLTLTLTGSFERRPWRLYRSLPLSFGRLTLFTLAAFLATFSLPALALLAVCVAASPVSAPIALLDLAAIPAITWLLLWCFRRSRLFALVACAIVSAAYLWCAMQLALLAALPAALLVAVLIRPASREYRASELP